MFFCTFIGYSQERKVQYLENEIYLKVKPSFSNKINDLNGVTDIKTELPFLENFIQSNKVLIQKIEKPFFSLKNKDFKSVFKLKISETENIDDIIEKLKAQGSYEYVEKVPARFIIGTPNDVSFPSQWSLLKINAPLAWEVNGGGANVTVAVVDNAVQTTHIDLASNMVAGKDMSSELDTDPNPPNDSFNHGTHVAGIVSAVTNNMEGIASASNNKVKIMPIKATPDDGNPNGIYYGFEGIVWAVDNGAKIISLSWGGGGYSQAEQDVINYAYINGVMVVAAAGNENSEDLHYPSAYNHVLSVASLDQTDSRSSFSSYGSTIDISAPGRGILSTLPTNVYGSFSGTSMATPLVASCLGYIWSCFPSLTLAGLEALIKNTADDISPQNPILNGKLGAGRINLLNAVACKKEGLDALNIVISPNKYFCEGDSVKLSIPDVSGASFEWSKNGISLSSTTESIFVKREGVYTLRITKGACLKTITSESLTFNKVISASPTVLNSESFYCNGQADTLRISSVSCSFPKEYEKIYSGGIVGYDNFEQSGPSPSVEFDAVPGLIDSLEITITWQKKDGGGPNSCGNADGGSIPYNEELGFQIKSPSGKIINLIAAGTFARGTVSSGIVTQKFKMGGNSIANNSLPTSGIFSPQGSFSVLIDDFPNGKWELLAIDDAQIDPLCVSGFGIKIFTDIGNSVSQVSWWDRAIGGNLLTTQPKLLVNNLSPGNYSYFAQNHCTGLCPSPRSKGEIMVKNVPEILAFPTSDMLITLQQAYEISTAIYYTISKNASHIYSVLGINSQNQAFNYVISNSGPHVSPVTICEPVDYVLLAMGCQGQIQWSNGSLEKAILIQGVKSNTQITANCNQSWACTPPPSSAFNFSLASSNQILIGIVNPSITQNTFGSTIASNQQIKPISTINYMATSHIILSPGFKVENGNTFSARIGNCPN